MKIGATSDLHGFLPDIEECDILLICGDILPLEIQSDVRQSQDWLVNTFLPWCSENKAKNVVFIAGNHDFVFERQSLDIQYYGLSWRKYGVYYIKDELIEVEGLKIYGTPWCHQFGNWAFMGSDEFLALKYSQIPEDLDILITHDAPSINNYGVITTPWNDGPFNAGNEILASYMLAAKPKLAFFGHLHSGDHNVSTVEGITMANVSLKDEEYNPVNKVLYIDYER